jgi:hypothetical protein
MANIFENQMMVIKRVFLFVLKFIYLPAVQPPSTIKDVPVIELADFVVKKYDISAISFLVENFF